MKSVWWLVWWSPGDLNAVCHSQIVVSLLCRHSLPFHPSPLILCSHRDHCLCPPHLHVYRKPEPFLLWMAFWCVWNPVGHLLGTELVKSGLWRTKLRIVLDRGMLPVWLSFLFACPISPAWGVQALLDHHFSILTEPHQGFQNFPSYHNEILRSWPLFLCYQDARAHCSFGRFFCLA